MWNNVERKLPVVEDDDEIGEIPYFVACYPEDPTNRFEDDYSMTNDDLFIGIGYYYGNNHWKNNNWEKIFVKYWKEIEELPND